MRIRFNAVLGLTLAMALTFGAFPISGYAQKEKTNAAIELYVAPDGSDSGKGTIDDPLATLEGAKNKVKSVKKDGISVTVYFRGGTYRFNNAVTFGESDSGSDTSSVVYKNYNNETPIFSGALNIKTEDFNPVDSDTEKRLPNSSKGKVGYVDLKKKGISHLTEYNPVSPDYDSLFEVYDSNVEFYFNDKAQNLARWPNGIDTWRRIKTAETMYDMIAGTDGRINRWKNVKSAVIEGYPRFDWAYSRVPIKNIDCENDRISVSNTSFNNGNYFATNGKWAISNLLEELDIPGEYYLDYKSLRLYYYPPYSTENVNMELAVNENNMIQFKNAKYISFEGITFEKNRNTVVTIDNSDNIKFLSCVFRQIALKGISSKKCENILVDGCDFVSLGSSAVDINEWYPENINYNDNDLVTRKLQNNTIDNCYFYDLATQGRTYLGATKISGCGNSIINSTIHNCKSGIIYFTGTDHKMNGNEVYNVLNSARDQGAVYSGRSVVFRGNEIANNHFHDIHTTSDGEGFVSAIYADDSLSGLNIHHNLFNNVEMAYNMNGGVNNKFNNNIVANTDTVFTLNSGDYSFASMASFIREQITKAYNLDAFKKEDYFRMLKFITSETRNGFGDEYKGNVIYNCKTIGSLLPRAVKYSNPMTDSLVLTGDSQKNMFVDEKMGNYTVKADWYLPDTCNAVKDINPGKSGIYESSTRKNVKYSLGEFKSYYPYNNTKNIPVSELILCCEKSDNADVYVFEIAKDKEFKEIVDTISSYSNYAYADTLENDGQTYYWRAYAKSLEYGVDQTKYQQNGPMCFTTRNWDDVNFDELDQSIEFSEKMLESTVEGTESGMVPQGAKQKLTNVVSNAENYKVIKNPRMKVINNFVSQIKEEQNNLLMSANVGCGDIGDIISDTQNNWVTRQSGNGFQAANGKLVLNNANTTTWAVYTNDKKPLKADKIYRFKIKHGVPEGGGNSVWQALSLQTAASAGTQLYNGDKLGYLLVIKDSTIEFQIWDGNGAREVKVIDNSLIPNELNDIGFGAVGVGTGQRVILEINNKTELDFAIPDYRIDDDLYFTVWDPPKKDGVKCSELVIENVTKESKQ